MLDVMFGLVLRERKDSLAKFLTVCCHLGLVTLPNELINWCLTTLKPIKLQKIMFFQGKVFKSCIHMYFCEFDFKDIFSIFHGSADK